MKNFILNIKAYFQLLVMILLFVLISNSNHIFANQYSYIENAAMTKRLSTMGYEEIADKDGVKVYKHKKSDIVKIAGETLINFPAKVILDSVIDYEGQLGVVERVTTSKVLEKKDGYIFAYQHLNLPIISDRDYLLEVKYWEKDKVYFVQYDVSNKIKGPQNKSGVVRIDFHSGLWQIMQLEDPQKSKVRFQVSVDMGGWLPKWLAKSGAGAEIPTLFNNIKIMINNKLEKQKKDSKNDINAD
ncbi:MAG: hypothetical protein ABIA04_15925 [Pseudomonadota bacterium]